MKLSFLDKLKWKKSGDELLPPPSPDTGYPQHRGALAREQRFIDYANELFSKGYSEAQVVDVLRREGLNFDEIDRIISSALRMRVSGEPSMPAAQQEYTQLSANPQFDQQFYNTGTYPDDFQESNESDITPLGQGTGGVLASEGSEFITMDEIEGFVETTVEEKMREMDEIINQFADKVEELERRINAVSASLEDEISKIKENLETISGDMRDTKDTLSQLEPRLNSLEKAFKDIVPNLVDSVREVKEMVHELESKFKNKLIEESTDLFPLENEEKSKGKNK